MTSFPPCDKNGHVSLHELGKTPSKYRVLHDFRA